MVFNASICNLKYGAKDEELIKLFRMSGNKLNIL